MKTREQLEKIIRDEIASIESLRSEDERIWSMRRMGGGVPEADAKRSKKIHSMIGKHNDEIVRLRRLIRYVEATPEDGIRMTLDQLPSMANHITASSNRYGSKELVEEYLSNAGMPLLRKQIAELDFLFQ